MSAQENASLTASQSSGFPSQKERRRLNFIYGALQSFFLSTNCAYFSFLVLYLNSQDYSESQIGIVMTLISIVSILAPSIFGYVADFIIPIKKIVIAMLLISIPIAISLHWTVSVVPLAMISITALGITERSMISVIDSWGMKIRVHKPYLNYGLTRGVGSLAFALAALSLGQLYDVVGIDKFYWVHGVIALFAVGSALLLEGVPTVARKKDDKSYFQTIVILLRNRRYVILLICMALHGLSMISIHTFQPILLTNLGGTSVHLGAAMFVMAASEVPVMFSSTRILQKYRVETLLNVAFAFTVVRVLSVVFSPNLGTFIGVQAFQSLSFGLYLPAIMFYISLITSDEMRATAITLAISVGFGLSGIIGNSIGGVIAQYFGVQMVYYVFAFMTFVALVIFSVSAYVSKSDAGSRRTQDDVSGS